MLDPTTAGAIAGVLAARGSNALDELLKPALKAGGESLLEKFRAWRAGNSARVIQRAEEIAVQSGYPLGPVPGRILMPILEYSSMEDDEALQKKWAALLANAASPTGSHSILPAFAEILRQLTPVHARMLDWIFENAQQPSVEEPTISTWRDVAADEVSHRFGLNSADYRIIASDLHRLQLIDGRRSVQISPYIGKGMGGSLVGSGVDRQTTASHYETIGLTPLGVAFIQACQPPVVGGLSQSRKNG